MPTSKEEIRRKYGLTDEEFDTIEALALRPTCEHCDKPLPPDSAEARICSFECTFCADCVEHVLHNVCPNCGGGIRMGYAHFYKRDLPSTLKVGTKVKAGQELVNVGNQGNSSGKHLHFEVRRNGSPIDGHQFLKKLNVSL